MRDFTLNLKHLPAKASFLVETLDKTHGDAVAAWEAMGKPEPPNREQTEALRKLAWSTKKQIMQSDATGILHVDMKLPAWSVVLIRQIN
jgi:xylan 1,4-beta-xylosidase